MAQTVLRLFGAVALMTFSAACATVDITATPQSPVQNAAYVEARAQLRDARQSLENTLREASLLSGEEVNATAKALSVLVYGWEGDPQARKPEDDYRDALEARTIERRVSLASVVAGDLNQISRAGTHIVDSADRLLALDDGSLPDNLAQDVSTVEKAMNMMRTSLGVVDQVLASSYVDTVPAQINVARARSEGVISDLGARADRILERQGALQAQSAKIG